MADSNGHVGHEADVRGFPRRARPVQWRVAASTPHIRRTTHTKRGHNTRLFAIIRNSKATIYVYNGTFMTGKFAALPRNGPSHGAQASGGCARVARTRQQARRAVAVAVVGPACGHAK